MKKLVRNGKVYEPKRVRVQWAKASDPDGPGDRVGVTDGKSEGFIIVNKPKGFLSLHNGVNRECMYHDGWVPTGETVELANGIYELA